MSKRLTLILALLLALTAVLALLLSPRSQEAPEGPVPALPQAPPPRETPLSDPVPEPVRSAPVELSLLVELAERARSGGRSAEPQQVGRSSALSGSVTDGWGAPFEGARLRFIAGLNQGYETVAGVGGRYEFASLFPGLHQMRVESRAGTILREVRLRPDAPETVDFSFGATSTVLGKVVDRKGKPIDGAKVEIDERSAWTDREGLFVLSGVFPGEAVVYASKEGHAYYRQNLSVPPNHQFEPGRLQVVLGPGGTLSGGVYPFGGQEPATLFLVPGVSTADRSIPYEKFAGIEVVAGGSFSIPFVPAESSLMLLAYHPRSAAQPLSRPILLRGRSENIVKLDFRFAALRPIQGEVRSGVTGDPISRARVRLFAKNPLASIGQVLRVAGPGMGSYLAPLLPFCRREVFTDAAGKFYLESGDGAVRSETMTLIVEADGHLPYEKAITGDAGLSLPVTLYTPESVGGAAALALRLQAGSPLRVSLSLNGALKAPREIEGGEVFAIDDLPPGLYRVELLKGDAALLREPRLPVTGRKEIEIVVPQ